MIHNCVAISESCVANHEWQEQCCLKVLLKMIQWCKQTKITQYTEITQYYKYYIKQNYMGWDDYK